MNMNLMDQKIYPNFKHYIKNDLPKVHNIPKIANALLKNGEIKKNTLQVIGVPIKRIKG